MSDRIQITQDVHQVPFYSMYLLMIKGNDMLNKVVPILQNSKISH